MNINTAKMTLRTYLIVLQGSAAIVLDPLPQEGDQVTLDGGLQGALGSLGLVNDGDGELGRVLARSVPDHEAVAALVVLGNAVEHDLGVALHVDQGYALAVFNELLSLKPAHLRGWLTEDGDVKL